MRTLSREQQKNLIAWIKALRSGKYKQTNYLLRSTIGFCCLGVACDIYDPEKWNNLFGNQSSFDGNFVVMPDYVKDSFGVDSHDVTKLASLNDREGKNFSEIADYIEKEILAPSMNKYRLYFPNKENGVPCGEYFYAIDDQAAINLAVKSYSLTGAYVLVIRFGKQDDPFDGKCDSYAVGQASCAGITSGVCSELDYKYILPPYDLNLDDYVFYDKAPE